MWPIAHVPHCPCAPSPRCPISICSINDDTPLPMCPIACVPHCPCAPSPKVSHLYLQYEWWYPFAHVSYCPYFKKDVKKSNTWTMEEVHKKINWHNEVHKILTSILMSHMMVTKNPQNVHRKCFWTILVTFIFDVKIDVNMCEPHYVNLFFVWTSFIVHMFDFLTFDIFFDILTSVWYFDIFLTFWHLF